MKSHTPECAKIEQFAATLAPTKAYQFCLQDFDTKDYTLEFCGRSITITQQEFAYGTSREPGLSVHDPRPGILRLDASHPDAFPAYPRPAKSRPADVPKHRRRHRRDCTEYRAPSSARESSRPGAFPGSGWRVALHHDPETTGKSGARSTVPETSRIPVEWLRKPFDRDENRPYPWHPGRSRLEAYPTVHHGVLWTLV